MSNTNNSLGPSALCDYCEMRVRVLKAEASQHKLLAYLTILRLRKAPPEVLEKANRDAETANSYMLKMKSLLKLTERRIDHVLERIDNHAAAEDIRMHYFNAVSWRDIGRRRGRSTMMIKRRASKALQEVGLTSPKFPNNN